ncbi:polyhomeotic-proximal chromatin protein-like [Cherax quadricarinatus]|uniref:polyhomeotic-proximal chromatin protein-like n=1 Tax=Cherax quadricarinatus TaxID=27406 RepID=UPI00387EB1DD
MWRLTATLLVATMPWTSASPQGYNYSPPNNAYLPPPPTYPSCQVAPITSVIYDKRVQTSINVQTVNQINTQYITTTLVRQQVIPTTVFQTRVQTQVQYQTSVIQRTTTFFNDRIVTQTIPSPPRQEVVYVTSTRVVPQVSYITSTQVQTQVIPVEVTRTQVQTINQPVTNYQTQIQQQTQVVPIPGPDVVRTRVQTVVQTSIVRRQQPANTRYVTSTRVQQVVQTSVVRGRDDIRTSFVQRQQVIPYTSVNTRYETAYTTREQVVIRTNFVTQTLISTQVVPQEVVSTQVVPNIIYTTIYETRFQPFTQVQTVVQTQYVTPAPVYQTREETRTSVVQVPGQDRVVTQQVAQTQQQQQVVYQTVNQPQQVTVTQTITATCGKTGYNYNPPPTPFNYGK